MREAPCSTSDPAVINQPLRGGERLRGREEKEMERLSGRAGEEEQMAGAVV